MFPIKSHCFKAYPHQSQFNISSLSDRLALQLNSNEYDLSLKTSHAKRVRQLETVFNRHSWPYLISIGSVLKTKQKLEVAHMCVWFDKVGIINSESAYGSVHLLNDLEWCMNKMKINSNER